MLILKKNKVIMSGFPDEVIQEIKSLLTITNPLLSKKMGLGLSTWGIPQKLEYWEKFSNSSLSVPTGALNDIFTICKRHNIELQEDEIIDSRVSNLKPDYFSTLKFSGTLRKYQEDVIKACMSSDCGIVESPTGSGKTVIFIKLIYERKEPTLILVHTKELAHQTIEEISLLLGIPKKEIGFIGSGKWNVYPITVGLHQTFNRLSEERFKIISDKFGQVIADEVHVCAAQTFYKTMVNLNAKYKVGFSATPERTDGFEKLVTWATGPIIHRVTREEIKEFLVNPSFSVVQTNYTFPLLSSQEYGIMIEDLSNNLERNTLIAEETKKYDGKNILLLCNRLSQVQSLHTLLGDSSVILTSKMKAADRTKTMQLLKEEKKRIVISTYGLFSTGINLPQLEILLMCCPIKSIIKIKQAIGRLMRLCEGKDSAIVIDFLDYNVDLLKYQFYGRTKIYKTYDPNFLFKKK